MAAPMERSTQNSTPKIPRVDLQCQATALLREELLNCPKSQPRKRCQPQIKIISVRTTKVRADRSRCKERTSRTAEKAHPARNVMGITTIHVSPRKRSNSTTATTAQTTLGNACLTAAP